MKLISLIRLVFLVFSNPAWQFDNSNCQKNLQLQKNLRLRPGRKYSFQKLPKTSPFQSSTQPSKRPGEALENTPTITINSPSISYNNNHDEQNGFKSCGNRSKKAEKLAFKLNRSRDKIGRYNSHMLFLEICIMGNVILNGLKLDLQPSIRNLDEKFLTC